MRKPVYSVVNNKSNGDVPKVYLYGVIGGNYYEIGREALYFKQELIELAKNYSQIDIHINGPGGSVWEGLPMANAILACTAETHTYNDGIAFSMCAVLLLAGKKIHVAKASMTMIHSANGGADGNAQDLREYAAVLDKHDEVLCTLLASRTGKTEEEVKALWLDYKDHYLTAKEMMDMGLADYLDDYDIIEAPTNLKTMSREQVSAYYSNKMDALIKAQTIQTDMKNPQAIMALATAGTTASQEILAAANAALTENGITNYGIYPESIVQDAATQTVENTRLTGEVSALTSRAEKAEGDLKAANDTIAAKDTEIANLSAKVVAFGKAPGAQFKPVNGNDTPPDGTDVQAVLDAMPHNKAADALNL